MARQRSLKDLFTGCGGQMAVLAELLMRQANVAVPEVDTGEDVFTFRTGQAEVTRIQVKTANAEPLKEEGRYAARVSVPIAQVTANDLPPLFYVFPVRLGGVWVDFVIIRRRDLLQLNRRTGVGYLNHQAGELQLYLSFGPDSLICSGRDLQPWRNAWDRLPVFQGFPDQPPGVPDNAGAGGEAAGTAPLPPES